MNPSVNWGNVLSRAAWTFAQGALGAVVVLPYISDVNGWKSLASGAAAGGVAALISFLKTLAQESLSPSAEPVPVARHELPVKETHAE